MRISPGSLIALCILALAIGAWMWRSAGQAGGVLQSRADAVTRADPLPAPEPGDPRSLGQASTFVDPAEHTAAQVSAAAVVDQSGDAPHLSLGPLGTQLTRLIAAQEREPRYYLPIAMDSVATILEAEGAGVALEAGTRLSALEAEPSDVRTIVRQRPQGSVSVLADRERFPILFELIDMNKRPFVPVGDAEWAKLIQLTALADGAAAHPAATGGH